MKKINGLKSSKFLQTRQQGFSTLMLLSFVFVFSASAYLGVRLAPSYMDYMVISGAMDEAVQTQSVETFRSKQIVDLIRRKMGPSATAPDINLGDVTSVFVRDGLKVVKINYEVVVPVIKNASALLHFTHEATINPYANVTKKSLSERLSDKQMIAAN